MVTEHLACKLDVDGWKQKFLSFFLAIPTLTDFVSFQSAKGIVFDAWMHPSFGKFHLLCLFLGQTPQILECQLQRPFQGSLDHFSSKATWRSVAVTNQLLCKSNTAIQVIFQKHTWFPSSIYQPALGKVTGEQRNETLVYGFQASKG